MSNEKKTEVTLKKEIQQTIDDLKELESQGISRMELIEIAKLGALHEIVNKLFALDQTLCEMAVNLDDSVCERTESYKVIIKLLSDIYKDIKDEDPPKESSQTEDERGPIEDIGLSDIDLPE